ncbi:MAG: signal transduction histidine kinase [Verrucomicrobiales bacterium]|jgi:signal transduction histidine kinase
MPMHTVENLRGLIGAVRKLAKATSLDQVYPVICATSKRLLQSDEAALVIVGEEGSCNYVQHPAELGETNVSFPSSSSLAGKCIKEGISLRVAAGTSDRAHEWIDAPDCFPSILVVPMGKEPSLGAVVVYWRKAHEPGADERRLLELLADSAVDAIESLKNAESLEIRVEERTLALQAVNEELQTFAYTVSHDLKTPISVVKTGVWTLRQLSGAEADPRFEKCLKRLDTAADRMRAQIDAMLAMYRLTRNEIVPVTIDLSATVQSILDELAESAPDRLVRFSVAPDLVANGDSVMIRTAMENLLSNAWKYSSRKELTEIEFGSSNLEDGSTVFFVRDKGAGFDMARAEKLFGVFQRFHADEEFSGTGIGLASVLRILHKHGGRIWAEAEPGKGATFHFTLPEKPLLEAPPEDHASIS